VLSTNITATNITALGSVGNTDGFDPESCSDVLVKNATIQVGDDAIAIKAGRDRDGWTYYKTTQKRRGSELHAYSEGGRGVHGKPKMSAGIRNIYIEDSTFSNSAGNLQYAIYVKAAVTAAGSFQGHLRQTADRRNGEQSSLYDWSLREWAVTGHEVRDFQQYQYRHCDCGSYEQQRLPGGRRDATALATGINLANITVTQSATPVLSSGSGHYTGSDRGRT